MHSILIHPKILNLFQQKQVFVKKVVYLVYPSVDFYASSWESNGLMFMFTKSATWRQNRKLNNEVPINKGKLLSFKKTWLFCVNSKAVLRGFLYKKWLKFMKKYFFWWRTCHSWILRPLIHEIKAKYDGLCCTFFVK